MNFKELVYLNNALLSSTESGDEFLYPIDSSINNLREEGGEDSEALIIPILPVNNIVLFPGIVFPIHLKNKKTIQLVKSAYKAGHTLGVVAQKTPAEDPSLEELFYTGTTAQVLKVIVFPEGNATILLQGRQRFQIEEILKDRGAYFARMHLLPETPISLKKKETQALLHSIKDTAVKLLKLDSEVPVEVQNAFKNTKNYSFLLYFLAANLGSEVAYRQELLELEDNIKRAKLLLKHLMKDLELVELKKQIQHKVHTDIDQQQRDYYLRQQIKILQAELGDNEEYDELEELRAKGEKKKWPEEVAQYFDKTLLKAERLNPHNADYSVLVNHAELLTELPWNEYSKESVNLKRAESILNRDHYGIEKVKERILEYLAVRKLKKDMKGPILCLYGPPGVGKTSLGHSIARALHREYVKVALGGVHDEAEVRGHRKTYVGAMPGRIIQGIKKAKTSNPVFLLDEIDKLNNTLRGDPASALLEALDPEQNHAFVDNFLEISYDLSQVLFIATANSLDTIPSALRDRLEIIEINGYTVEEKVQITKKYLLPKQRKAHGLQAADLNLNTEAIVEVIENYTSESGVRDLERKMGALARKTAKAIALEESHKGTLHKDDVTKLLGMAPFDLELYQRVDIPGVAIGLAWTPVGGEILFIESSLAKGKGKLTISGQLGEVMEESVMAAISYLKAQTDTLGIDYRVFDQYDLHLHIPDGATPKEGPSAGIALFTALASLYTQRKVKDRLAMTGEITLRGKVLPVGGIKEKILAAKRAGIKEVILCHKNKRDVQEIKPEYIKDLQFQYVDRVDEVLTFALQVNKARGAKVWHLDEDADK